MLRRLEDASPASLRGRRIDIWLVDDRTIAGLAGRFRGSPRATDVLAFGYVPGVLGILSSREMADGEIFISLDMARRQAVDRRVPLVHELALLCVHGMWHIAGQGDETSEECCGMRRREFETLAKILRGRQRRKRARR